MNRFFTILILGLFQISIAYGQQSQSIQTPESQELWRIFQQIADLKTSEQDVPSSLYEQYYELDRVVNPELYGREEGSQLDQFQDLCPGGVVTGPDSGQTYLFATNGSSQTATNNCSFPSCRIGRDLFLTLDVMYKDSITITTCGSGFDTYLCIFQGACCGQPGSVLFASNDNAPEVCGVATTLQAGVSRCFDPGRYYICLDGYGAGAFGNYSFRIQFHGNSCIPPITEPECPADFEIHEETFPEGCDAFANTVNCNQGFCGQIDQSGDLDVYALTVTECARLVTVSVWADDTPGRTGFEGGLNSHLRLWPVTCEAPLAVNNDFNGGEGSPVGTDSQLQIILEPGTYFFEISGAESTTGPYEIFVGCSPCEQ
ncbi:hypothetical protein HUU59_02745 [bacterium]|nr:hypothetical protein [bacterium]